MARAASEEKVDGVPGRNELVTISVTHDVAEREIELLSRGGRYGP